MANAKKKPSTKRTVKYAAKAQTGARQTSASSTTGLGNKGAIDWQKGASDWAKQSAKLYQMPFAQGDVDAATKQAADTVKSAAENAVKMSNDFMQQMFGQQQSKSKAFNPMDVFQNMQKQMPEMPQMDMGEMQKKMASFATDMQQQLGKLSSGGNRASAEAAEISRENIEVLTEVCNIAVSVTKELMAEMISYSNKQFSQNVELSKQVLACRTLNDMFDLSTRMLKSNLDAFFSESVKISEKLFQCANDVSEPLNECMSGATERLSKAMTA